MRVMFSLIALVLIGTVLWLAIRYGDRLYYRMQLNKATHEFLTRRESDAIRHAVALLNRHPDYRPALEAAVQWMVAMRDFDGAWELAQPYAMETLPAPTRYHLAVCAYVRGDEEQALRLCDSLISSGAQSAEVPMPLVSAYPALSRGYMAKARTLLEGAGNRYQGNLLYHSLFGWVCYADGDVVRAGEQLAQALQCGDRNPRARLFLAVCHALRGDLPAMAMLLDGLERAGHKGYAQATREIELWQNRIRNRTYISPDEQMVHRQRLIHLRLADAAIQARHNDMARADEILVELSRDFPDLLGIATRRALLLEQQKQVEAALQLYRQEADRLFLAAYKLLLLDRAANETSESLLLRRYLTTGSLVLDARAMNPSSGQAGERGWVLNAAGEFTRSFTVHSTGNYSFDLIARGTSAEGIWPIVAVSIDGKLIAEQYINSPVWDLYEIRYPLLTGLHTLQLKYTNDYVILQAPEHRSFQLDRVIVRPQSN
ncbi:MAG: hypothetical protein N3D11_08480 [Candidatus Sumerlaeia bacterium]|nr:hypothetical protein [Candidatus Sumerlaeia bacterium]